MSDAKVVNTYLCTTQKADGSVILRDFINGEVGCEIPCANNYVARSVSHIIESNYSDARRTAFIMNKFYAEGGKYDDDF